MCVCVFEWRGEVVRLVQTGHRCCSARGGVVCDRQTGCPSLHLRPPTLTSTTRLPSPRVCRLSGALPLWSSLSTFAFSPLAVSFFFLSLASLHVLLLLLAAQTPGPSLASSAVNAAFCPPFRFLADPLHFALTFLLRVCACVCVCALCLFINQLCTISYLPFPLPPPLRLPPLPSPL